MSTLRAALSPLREQRLDILGGLASIAIAAVIYSQFNLYGWLKRDSAIYIYGGQQMTHGVPPYASIMDPKGPLASILCGLGTALARLLGRDDVLVIRVEFFAISVLTVLAVYLLALEVWQGIAAGLAAAVVFASFEGYAGDALAGPNAHTPGILFLVVAMWLTARRSWYRAGFCASLAFLVWQPLFPYPIIVLLCAAVWSAERRLASALRCVAGVASPFVALMTYYAAEGHLGSLFEGLFVFPLEGVSRAPMSPGQRIHRIFRDVHRTYHISGYLLWLGIVLMVLAALWTVISARSAWRQALTGPIVLLVVLSLVGQVGYALYDYQGYSHAFPLLPYGALGFGAATAYATQWAADGRMRQAVTGAVLAAVIAATAAFAVDYHRPALPHPALRAEQATACAIQRSLVPGTPLWSLGDPLALVLLHRRNPDNYPYLGSGLDRWKIKHTTGGFAGWTAQIRASRASVVVLDVWKGPVASRMERWLRAHGYRHGFIGPWQVFVTPLARARMATAGVALADSRSLWPRTSTGERLMTTRC